MIIRVYRNIYDVFSGPLFIHSQIVISYDNINMLNSFKTLKTIQTFEMYNILLELENVFS